MVSPYLLRPVRELKEVLAVAQDPLSAPGPVSRSFPPRNLSGTAAAILRQQGRIARPRVVWVNEPKAPKGPSSAKPRKSD